MKSNFFGQNDSKYLNQFSIKNYTERPDIVQNLYKFWAQNVSIPPPLDQNMSQGGGMFQYPHIVYYFLKPNIMLGIVKEVGSYSYLDKPSMILVTMSKQQRNN